MNEIPYHRIAHQFYNRPLYLLPSVAETISAFLMSRIGAGPRGAAAMERSGESAQAFPANVAPDGSVEYHSPRASRFYGEYPIAEDGSRRPEPYRRTGDGVAILSLIGEWVNRGAWIGSSSGLISYEGFKYQLQRAVADQKVTGILLDMESPGGEAVGAFEAAAAVRDAAAAKPVTAVVNGMAASAAYAIASGASRIVTMPTGISGSIGVVLMHLDFSKWLAEEGIKPTLIFAGAHKVDGNAFEPLPDDVRTDLQREVSGFHDQFVQTVAAGRRSLTEDAIRATEARVFKGQEAVDVGLADAVGTFEQVLADLSRGSGRSSSSPKGSKMDKNVGEPAAAVAGLTTGLPGVALSADFASAAALASAYPELTAQLRTEAAADERARILGIEDVAVPGHEKLVADMKADGKTTPDQAAARILRAEKETRKGHAQAIRDVEFETSKVPAAPSANGGRAAPPKAATPDAWKAQWEASADLQAEFATVERYIAYQQGVANGRIRILDRKAV